MIMVVGLMSPYSLRSANAMELFNESCVLLINYHLICFTDFLKDLRNRDQVGFSLIVLTILNIAVNLGQITFMNMSKVLRKIKIFRLKVKQ
jgi:hypothetical protein